MRLEGAHAPGEADETVAMTIVNRTLREQVLEQLRTALLEGTFAPGEKLAEVELAAEFGVSRGTVREALRTLHNSGLLEGSERSSLHVRRLNPRQVIELYDVRAALEGQAVAAIMRADDAQAKIAELETLLPETRPGMTYAERFEVDLGFHEALCRLSGNETLLRMWTSIKDLMRMSVLAEPDEASGSLMTKSHHKPIIDAMRTGEPDRARAVLAAHMATAADVWSRKAASR
jgi:DNA-binding GntR family transcriptional regulator